jgi:hypothetical protein
MIGCREGEETSRLEMDRRIFQTLKILQDEDVYAPSAQAKAWSCFACSLG